MSIIDSYAVVMGRMKFQNPACNPEDEMDRLLTRFTCEDLIRMTGPELRKLLFEKD